MPAAAAGFTDIPANSWATDVIRQAVDAGLMEGMGGGLFGYGQAVTRAQFVTVLCRMFDWTLLSPAATSFTDCPTGKWYFTYVETALAHDVMDAGPAFRPEAYITREEMAVMLVRALGYRPLAEKAERVAELPFTDVFSSRGYIAVAYDIGMINGRGGGIFAPGDTAKREEMAAILVRVYSKLRAGTEWMHGFYAFSSYSQRQLTGEMDAVSAGWSRLCLENGSVQLNTTASGGNEWCIPDSYESITGYLDNIGTPLHLDVYMDNVNDTAAKVLTSEAHRSRAVEVIVAEATKAYAAIGKSPYSGVTIDFEGLYGASQREGFTAFLALLDQALEARGLHLFVAVQPVAEYGYFDGYDYRAIGELADKVILMAHDYNAVDLSGFESSSYHKTAALTPLDAVYYSLREITDPETGVSDRSKLVLAISFNAMAWSVRNDLLQSGTPVYPSMDTVRRRLLQPDTMIGWSETYKNPYAVYKTESGEEFFLWYEDARSVSEKLQLARLFGINGVSLWRLGTIPVFEDAGIYMDVWNTIQNT